MKLRRVELEAYRSFKERVEVFLDRRVTVLLGANDHGKTNFLEALLHLNEDRPFDEERDLNLERTDDRESLPEIKYEFELTQTERETLLGEINKERRLSFMDDAIQRNLESLDELDSRIEEVEATERDARTATTKAENALSEAMKISGSRPTSEERQTIAAGKAAVRDAQREHTKVQSSLETVRQLKARAANTSLLVRALGIQERAMASGGAPEDAFQSVLEESRQAVEAARSRKAEAEEALEIAEAALMAAEAEVDEHGEGEEEEDSSEEEESVALPRFAGQVG